MDYITRMKYQGNEPFLWSCLLDENLRPGATCGPIIRESYVVECNTGGYGAVVINGVEFAVRPRDCYILLPGDTVIHKSAMKNPREGIYCIIGGKRVGDAFTEAGISSKSPFVAPEFFDDMESVLRKMYEIRYQHDVSTEYRCTGLIYEMLSILTRNKVKTYRENYIQRAIAIMESTYHMNISIADISMELGFERTYFSTVFKEHTGLTPYAYLTSLRIDKALAILSDEMVSIGECAECVGLDPTNFSRIFKKHTGITPLEYKKSQNTSKKQ